MRDLLKANAHIRIQHRNVKRLDLYSVARQARQPHRLSAITDEESKGRGQGSGFLNERRLQKSSRGHAHFKDPDRLSGVGPTVLHGKGSGRLLNLFQSWPSLNGSTSTFRCRRCRPSVVGPG